MSGDRYRVTKISENLDWPVVELGEVIKLNFGERITKKESQGTKYPVYGGGGESFRTDEFNRDSEYVIARFAMSENCVRYVDGKFWMMDSGGTFSIKPDYIDKVDKDYVGKILLNQQDEVYACARGGAQKNLNNEHFYQIKIPLPPIEIQREIVAELDGYQKIIDAAQTIVQTYKPTIKMNPDWETKTVAEISERVTKGTTPTTAGFQYKDNGVNFVKVESITDTGEFIPSRFAHVDDGCHQAFKRSQLKAGDVLFSIAGALGRVAQVDSSILPANTNQALSIITPTQDILPSYLAHVLKSDLIARTLDGLKVGVAQSNLSLAQVSNFKIPLPPIETQREIVAELEAEQQLINANKKLIEIYQQKIKSKIAEVWSE